MKAVRLVEIGQPLELQEIPVPDVGDQDVLVRIEAAGICHSDQHYRAGHSAVGSLPQTLGHEIAGVAEAVGSQVTTIKAGDRVCLHYLLSCGNCYFCSFFHSTAAWRKSCNGNVCQFLFIEYFYIVNCNVTELCRAGMCSES